MTDLDLHSFESLSPANLFPIESHNAGESVDVADVANIGFSEMLYKGNFTFVSQASLETHYEGGVTLETLGYFLPPCTVIRMVETPFYSRKSILLRGNDFWFAAEVYSNRTNVRCGANSLERVKEILERFQHIERKAAPEGVVRYEMSAYGNILPSRKFDNVLWNSIRTNYATPTRRELESLVKIEEPALGDNDGRIILFHGLPGTGKTWAIRSLLTHWKAWADPILILDSELIFSRVDYFMDVISNTAKGKTRILIIEDADGLVEKDGARSSDLSRLLNMADGLLGASYKVLFLLTTNAKIRDLDQAIVRPGRCRAIVDFQAFDRIEATTRLGKAGIATRPMTLAEIYRVEKNPDAINDLGPVQSVGQYL